MKFAEPQEGTSADGVEPAAHLKVVLVANALFGLVGLSDSDSKRRDARKLCAIRSRKVKRVARISAA